jgi:hypothetical protein
MTCCPLCDDLLLRQFRQHRLTLFCPSCWQETPLAIADAFVPIAVNRVVERLPSKVISLNQVRSQNLQRLLETA